MPKRCHFKQTETLRDGLATFAKLMRERASLKAGAERATVLAKAERADRTAAMDQWIRSSELKRPE
jgi:hypothetical protein